MATPVSRPHLLQGAESTHATITVVKLDSSRDSTAVQMTSELMIWAGMIKCRKSYGDRARESEREVKVIQ